MLSRIFWIGITGIALIVGMAIQDGDRIFSWTDDREQGWHHDRSIEDQVDRAIDGSFDKMQVVGPEGREIDVPAETKRALADAVGRLIKAEADLALARIGEDDQEAMQAASERRARARADVDRLKAEIKNLERAANSDNNALRDQIRREIQEDVRAAVRESVRS